MKKLLLPVILILVSLNALGQYTQVYLPYPSGACLGASYQVSVSFNSLSSGTLAHIVISDDNFITQDTLGTATNTASNYVAVSLNIPASLTPGTNFRLKALVDGELSYSSAVFAVIEANATVAMTGSYMLDLCTGYSNIPLTLGGDFPITVAFQKASETPQNTIYYSYSSPVKQVYEAGVYEITSVSNTCGAGVVAASPNSQVTVTDPTYTFGISHLGDSILCEGESFKVFFDNSISCAAEIYTIQYSEIGQSTWINMTSNDDSSSLGYIIGTTPTSFANETKKFKLRLRLYTGGSNYYTDEYHAIQVINRPSIAMDDLLIDYFTTGSDKYDLARGEYQKAGFDLSGTGPWEINLDGNVFKKDSTYFTMDFSPEESQTYHFLSVKDSTGCMNKGLDISFDVYDNIFTHRILDNRDIDLSNHWRNYCREDPMLVDYHIRGELPGAGFSAQIGFEDQDGSWRNIDYTKTTNRDQIELIIPDDLPKGRYSFRMVPFDASVSFKSKSMTLVNDYTKPNSTFFVMDSPYVKFGEPAISQIYANDDFHLPFLFSGGPEHYDGSLPSDVYKPLVVTDGDSLWFGKNGLSGFDDLKSEFLIDTLSVDRVFTLQNMEANLPAGSYDCISTAEPYDLTPIEVEVISEVAGFSINTATISGANNLCSGGTINVPFTSTGSFMAGNDFKVQLKEYTSKYSSGVALSNYFDVEVLSFTSSSVTIRLPLITERKPNFYYKARVVSSDPVVLGTASTTWLEVGRTMPVVKLSGEAYVQAGSTAEVFIESISDPFFTFNLTDGTNLSGTLYSYNYSTEKTAASVLASGSSSIGSTINISTAAFSNACGTGVSTGNGEIHIVGSRQLNLSGPISSSFCQKGKFKVQISSGQTINADNVYSAKLIRVSSGAEVLGTEIENLGGGWFEVTVSEQFTVGSFQLTIYSSSPFMRSNVYDFNLYSRPTVTASLGQILIEKGDTATIEYAISGGTAPYQLELSSNDRLVSENVGTGTFFYKVRPLNTTTFNVAKLIDANGCSKVDASSSKTVEVISNTEEVEIISVATSKFCEGNQMKILYRTEVIPDALNVQLSDENGENFMSISSSIYADSILFTIPSGLSVGVNYQLRLHMTKAAVSSYSIPVLLSEMGNSSLLASVISGEVDIVNDADLLYFTGDESFIEVDFVGLPPYEFKVSNGDDSAQYFTNSNPFKINVRPDSTREYVVEQMANRCGIGTNSGGTDFDVYHLNISDVLNPYFCQEVLNKAGYTAEGDFGVPTVQSGPFLHLLSLDPDREYESFNARSYIIPITWSADSIAFVIPPTVPVSINATQLYRVRLISNFPDMDGGWADDLVRVSESNPVITILGSTNVDAGTTTPLTIKTDKDVIGYGYMVGPGGQDLFILSKDGYTINKTINTTSTYSIGAVYPACGTASVGDPATAIITVGPCPPNQHMSLDIDPPASRTFETSGTIEAINKIGSGTDIVYDAESSILLQPGFEAFSGAVFRAIIDGCE